MPGGVTHIVRTRRIGKPRWAGERNFYWPDNPNRNSPEPAYSAQRRNGPDTRTTQGRPAFFLVGQQAHLAHRCRDLERRGLIERMPAASDHPPQFLQTWHAGSFRTVGR